MNSCEKIATLGDCYYCVSGCPKSVDEHAELIVEMGRSMCVAIQQFDEDHNEQVYLLGPAPLSHSFNTLRCMCDVL